MFGIDAEAPFSKLPKKHRDLLLSGPPAAAAKAAKAAKAAAAAAAVPADDEEDGDEEFELPPTRRRRPRDGELDPFGKDFEGVIPNLRRRYEEGSWVVQEDLEPYRTLRECPTCQGHRLKPQSLAVRVKNRGIAEYVNLPISEALEVFERFELTERESLIADPRAA